MPVILKLQGPLPIFTIKHRTEIHLIHPTYIGWISSIGPEEYELGEGRYHRLWEFLVPWAESCCWCQRADLGWGKLLRSSVTKDDCLVDGRDCTTLLYVGLILIHYDRSPSNRTRFHEMGTFCVIFCLNWGKFMVKLIANVDSWDNNEALGYTKYWNDWLKLRILIWFPQLDKDQWYWVVLSSPCWLCLFPCTGTPSSCIVWNQTMPWKMNRCFFQNLATVDVNMENRKVVLCWVTELVIGYWKLIDCSWFCKRLELFLALHACTFVPLEDSQYAVPHGEASISFQGLSLLGVFDGSSPLTDTIFLFLFFIFPSIFKQSYVLVKGSTSTCDFSC